MFFEFETHLAEAKDWHHLFHRWKIRALLILAGDSQVLWRTDPGDYVLSLGVNEILAIERVAPFPDRGQSNAGGLSSPILPNIWPAR